MAKGTGSTKGLKFQSWESGAFLGAHSERWLSAHISAVSTQHELLARALLHFVQSLGSVPVLVPKRWHSCRSDSFIPAFPQPPRWNNHIQRCTHVAFLFFWSRFWTHFCSRSCSYQDVFNVWDACPVQWLSWLVSVCAISLEYCRLLIYTTATVPLK